MSAQNCEEQQQTKQMGRRPHIRWANQIIKLAQGQLSETRRQELENHLQKCAACKETYLFYRGVSSLVRETPPPAVPEGLPPMLQQLKQKLGVRDIKKIPPLEPPARQQETLQEVADKSPQQQVPDLREETPDPQPFGDIPAEKETHPAVAEAKRILRSSKGPSHSKKDTKMV